MTSTGNSESDKLGHPSHAVEVGLNAAIIAVRDLTPLILEVDLAFRPSATMAYSDISAQNPIATSEALPFGPFDPLQHRTLETGLRRWVEQQTSLTLGYVEQLYTFGDRGRALEPAGPMERGTGISNLPEVSIGYLALTHSGPGDEQSDETIKAMGGRWRSWYRYFPWEDWRNGRPSMLDEEMLPALTHWAETCEEDNQRSLSPLQRLRLSFGLDGAIWDEERVLERYELLYEAGLVLEHFHDQGCVPPDPRAPLFGKAMHMDHRRILATAISRLRGKLKYRPVVFELMPESFTLTQLQATVEAISGRHLHKQNFRRLVEQGQLVEPTGATSTATGGRPAALFRFRRSVLAERPAPGLRLGSSG